MSFQPLPIYRPFGWSKEHTTHTRDGARNTPHTLGMEQGTHHTHSGWSKEHTTHTRDGARNTPHTLGMEQGTHHTHSGWSKEHTTHTRDGARNTPRTPHMQGLQYTPAHRPLVSPSQAASSTAATQCCCVPTLRYRG